MRVNTPISARQWGFMSNCSTASALIKVVDDWQRVLDVSKAFDTVPHSLLPVPTKLNELGLDPYLL